MSDKNDGGQAFPSIKTDRQYTTDINIRSVGGMTLRDYFAAKAMQSGAIEIFNTSESDALASYLIADAMIKARDGDV
jgi:hypothetical protein